MGDSVADSVTNRTEFEGLAGVEVCGPGQGKLMLLILKLSESRNIQIHKCSPLGVLYERRIQTEPFPTCCCCWFHVHFRFMIVQQGSQITLQLPSTKEIKSISRKIWFRG